VKLVANCGVSSALRRQDGGFEVTITGGDKLVCDKLLLATGGCRTPALGQLAVSLGHTLEPPVPSLFTFHIDDARLVGAHGARAVDEDGAAESSGDQFAALAWVAEGLAVHPHDPKLLQIQDEIQRDQDATGDRAHPRRSLCRADQWSHMFDKSTTQSLDGSRSIIPSGRQSE
jgi:hypothetical protein